MRQKTGNDGDYHTGTEAYHSLDELIRHYALRLSPTATGLQDILEYFHRFELIFNEVQDERTDMTLADALSKHFVVGTTFPHVAIKLLHRAMDFLSR